MGIRRPTDVTTILFSTMVSSRRKITHKHQSKIKLTYDETGIEQVVDLQMADSSTWGTQIPLLTPIVTADEKSEHLNNLISPHT